MDDVLQPRSRHSWDVLKAWFRVGPNDIGNGVTEDAGKRRRGPDSPEKGEVVATGAAADAGTDAVRSEENREGEPSDDVGAGVGEGGGGSEQDTITAAPAAAVASPADAPTTEAEEKPAEVAAPQAAVAAAAAAPEPEPAVAKPAAAAAATAPSRAASPPLEAAATAAAEVGGATIGDNDDTTVASEGSPSAATSGGGWRVVECKVGTDGTCENCGEVLRSIDLSKEDEDRLLQQVSAACCGTVLMPRFSNEGYLGFFGALGSRAFEPLPRLVCLSWDGVTWSCFPAPVLRQGSLFSGGGLASKYVHILRVFFLLQRRGYFVR